MVLARLQRTGVPQEDRATYAKRSRTATPRELSLTACLTRLCVCPNGTARGSSGVKVFCLLKRASYLYKFRLFVG